MMHIRSMKERPSRSRELTRRPQPPSTGIQAHLTLQCARRQLRLSSIVATTGFAVQVSHVPAHISALEAAQSYVSSNNPQYPLVVSAETPAQLLVVRLFSAINNRDLATLFSLLTDDCTYDNLAVQTVHSGKRAVCRFYADAVASLPEEAVFIIDALTDGAERVGVSWHMEMNGIKVPLSRGVGMYTCDRGSKRFSHISDSPEHLLKFVVPLLSAASPLYIRMGPALLPAVESVNSILQSQATSALAGLATLSNMLPGPLQRLTSQPLAQLHRVHAQPLQPQAPHKPSPDSRQASQPMANAPPGWSWASDTATVASEVLLNHSNSASGTAGILTGASASPKHTLASNADITYPRLSPSSPVYSIPMRQLPTAVPSSSRSSYVGTASRSSTQACIPATIVHSTPTSSLSHPHPASEKPNGTSVPNEQPVTLFGSHSGTQPSSGLYAGVPGRNVRPTSATVSAIAAQPLRDSHGQECQPSNIDAVPVIPAKANFSGLWEKDYQNSDEAAYEAMLDVLQLHGLQKTTARLIEGIDIIHTDERFDVNFVTIVPFFRVTESSKFGQETTFGRRDLRLGKSMSNATYLPSNKVQVAMRWGEPLAGSLVEEYSFAAGASTSPQLLVVSTIQMGGKQASVRQVYRRSAKDKKEFLNASRQRNNSLESVLKRHEQKYGRP